MLPSTKLNAMPSVPTETIVHTDTQSPPPQTCITDSAKMKKLHVPDSMNSIEIPMTGSVLRRGATSDGKGLVAPFAASVLVESQEVGATIKPSSFLSKSCPTTQEMPMQDQSKTRAASRALNGLKAYPFTPESTAATQPAKPAPQKKIAPPVPPIFQSTLHRPANLGNQVIVDMNLIPLLKVHHLVVVVVLAMELWHVWLWQCCCFSLFKLLFLHRVAASLVMHLMHLMHFVMLVKKMKQARA